MAHVKLLLKNSIYFLTLYRKIHSFGESPQILNSSNITVNEAQVRAFFLVAWPLSGGDTKKK